MRFCVAIFYKLGIEAYSWLTIVGGEMKESKVKSINSLARGLSVLQIVQSSGPIKLHELYRISKIPKASLLRILKTLIEQGALWQRIIDGSYVASYSLYQLANRMNSETRLVEISSPILESLSNAIKWPSVLAVPRQTHMEVLETNAPRSYFHEIPLGPVGFKINMLWSATGRAYISFCEEALRHSIVDTLRRKDSEGGNLSLSEAALGTCIEETRRRGYGLRAADFRGSFDENGIAFDDGRDSLGVAIRVGTHVPGAINVTWARRALSQAAAIELLAKPVMKAAEDIAEQLLKSHSNFTQ
jgi:IclR family transcriptional regulator, mhp operon transcriptional activator